MVGILTLRGYNVPKDDLIGAILATDKFVACGNEYNWYSSDSCPGGIFTRKNVYDDNDVGYAISLFICVVLDHFEEKNREECYKDYADGWPYDWPLTRRVLVETYNLGI